MPRFFAGDELGAIKSVSYARLEDNKTWQCDPHTLSQGNSSGNRSRAIQKLAVSSAEGFTKLEVKLAAVRADGSSSTFQLMGDNVLEEQSTWQETRMKEGQRFVGLSLTERGVYSCTSNGALRLTKPGEDDGASEPSLARLPLRLTEWRLASNEQTFAYAGDEVELSLWDTDRAFSSGVAKQTEVSKTAESASNKRKRSEQLLPNEIWRAKNLANDELNLRQPVRNTAFAYLQPSVSPSHQNILVGTQFGDVRRYDTRAGRRPVSNWKGIGKTGGIGVIENGLNEHQVFVSDRGSSLFALDLRNGKVSYGYKGFSGAITSISICPALLVSGAEDRYVRLHSTFPPPSEVGQQQEHKGDVVNKTYVNVVPTVIVWDGIKTGIPVNGADIEDDGDDGSDGDVWDEMEEAESEEEHAGGNRKKSKVK